jgi:hypothetical protein
MGEASGGAAGTGEQGATEPAPHGRNGAGDHAGAAIDLLGQTDRLGRRHFPAPAEHDRGHATSRVVEDFEG